MSHARANNELERMDTTTLDATSVIDCKVPRKDIRTSNNEALIKRTTRLRNDCVYNGYFGPDSVVKFKWFGSDGVMAIVPSAPTRRRSMVSFGWYTFTFCPRRRYARSRLSSRKSLSNLPNGHSVNDGAGTTRHSFVAKTAPYHNLFDPLQDGISHRAPNPQTKSPVGSAQFGDSQIIHPVSIIHQNEAKNYHHESSLRPIYHHVALVLPLQHHGPGGWWSYRYRFLHYALALDGIDATQKSGSALLHSLSEYGRGRLGE